MGAGYHGGFGNTTGANKPSPKKKEPIFNKKGHVTLESIKARAEFFLESQLPGWSTSYINMDMKLRGDLPCILLLRPKS